MGFSEIVRAPDGLMISVEIDDVVGTSGVLVTTGALIGSWLRLNEGTHRVRVGINDGPQLEIVEHGYRRAGIAESVARLLVDEIRATGRDAITSWDSDPTHWQEKVAASPAD